MSQRLRSIEVRATELVSALTLLAAAQKAGHKLKLTFRNDELEFRRGATTVHIAASGSWPGAATTASAIVRDLLKRRKAFPEVVELIATDTAVHFSHFVAPCIWTTP